MKILFCIYTIDYADHIALSYLSAVAKKRGHETFLCVVEYDDFIKKVQEIKPDLVAFSANSFGVDELIAKHKEAKKLHNYKSMLGGPHATFNPEIYKQDNEIDVYCIGEGELAFDEFLECLEEDKSYSHVLNLVSKDFQNPVRDLIADIDTIPMPDRALTLENTFLKITPKKTFYATRGCPFHCNYCCNSFFHKLYRGKGKIVRRFSVERIIQEIEMVRDSDCRMDFLKFGDDVFAMNANEWLEEFAEKYKERIGIPFNCYLRIDNVSEKLLALLKKAGCYSVHLSIDSLSEHVREVILGRNMKKVDFVETLLLFDKYDIKTWVNFMLAAPDSKIEDDLETVRVAKKGKITYASFSITTPLKQTKLFDICLERGYIDGTNDFNDMNNMISKSILPCFTPKEKTIQFNTFLLGAIVSKLPRPLFDIGMFIIKKSPSLKLFTFLRTKYLVYSLRNNIFKLPKEATENDFDKVRQGTHTAERKKKAK